MPRCSLWLVLLGLLLAAGCGGGKSSPAAISKEQVETIIVNLPDSAMKPDRFKTYFAAGSLPDDATRVKYGPLSFHPQKTSISGDQATCLVSIEDTSGTKLGEKEWTLIQEGGAWKLQAAPLP